ncbi:hypothetical protein AAG906_020019 [Vitis piasezkii]
MVKEVKAVITLRSGKEVDLPTCKLEHKVESESRERKEEEIKGKKMGKRIVIKEELMKKHMPPPFLQALYGKIIRRNTPFRCEMVAKSQSVKSPIFAAKALFRRVFRNCETTLWHTSAISQPRTLISQLRNGSRISQPKPHFAGCFAAAKHPFGTRVPFRSRPTPFRNCENGTRLRKSHLAAKCFRSPIATPCQILHLLRKWLFVAK